MQADRHSSQALALILFLFALGAAGTVIIEATGGDLAWTAAFFQSGGDHGGWVHAGDLPWRLCYDYGEIPGILAAVAGLAAFVAAASGRIPRKYAAPCLVVLLTVLLGPGLLVNGLLKNGWGRPRPADIAQFGGSEQFRPVWSPGGPGSGKSFPCGHCSMGFALASGIAFYPLHPTIAAGSLIGSIIYGAVAGKARMAQGGHFATDVLWSGVLVLSLVFLLYGFLVGFGGDGDR